MIIMTIQSAKTKGKDDASKGRKLKSEEVLKTKYHYNDHEISAYKEGYASKQGGENLQSLRKARTAGQTQARGLRPLSLYQHISNGYNSVQIAIFNMSYIETLYRKITSSSTSPLIQVSGFTFNAHQLVSAAKIKSFSYENFLKLHGYDSHEILLSRQNGVANVSDR